MKKVFGKEMCSECQKIKKEYQEKGIDFEYYDLDTVDGLSEAAFRGLIKDNMILPIIIEEED